MVLKITVTCEELVKPSSVTPNHLRFYPFSFLDQLAPPYFIPFLVFYENKTNLSNKERADLLKTSLSKILSQFYPLAGRIKKTGVECNDEGVRFIEAKADCKMSEILENPNSYDLNKFLTFEHQEVSDVPLKVQLTFFDCGGLVLGVGLCHRLCDALSCFMFVKNWTAFARGNTNYHDLITPCFDLAKLFPPCDMVDFNISTGEINKNIVTKRFVFSKSSLESLRVRFSGNNEFKATRVEALSEFIWSRYIASKADDEIGKMYAIIHPVNLRRFGDGIIPENIFGNVLSASFTISQGLRGSNNDEERCSLVQKMRDGIRKIDKEYVKKLQEDNKGHKELFIREFSAFNNENISTFVFSSLCRLPVYEVDFGWGKPSWVSSATICNKNLVAFFDTKEGDGIEAWVNMEDKDMSRFEADQELLSYNVFV